MGINSDSAALDFRGKAWTWGYNNWGQLGNNTTSNEQTPIAVYGNKTFCEIKLGNQYAMGLDNNGKSWGWGYNTWGALGIINITLTPILINF